MMVYRSNLDGNKKKRIKEIKKEIDKIGNKYKKIISKKINILLYKNKLSGHADILIDIRLEALFNT